MQVFPKIKAARNAARQPSVAAAYGPAGEDLREAGHVSLGVSAIHSEGVEL